MYSKRKLTDKMVNAMARLERGDKLYYQAGNMRFMQLPRVGMPTINGLFARGFIEYEPEFEGSITGYIVLSRKGWESLRPSAHVEAAKPA